MSSISNRPSAAAGQASRQNSLRMAICDQRISRPDAQGDCVVSVTNGEEQILDRIKDFLAEEPGIEVVEPPAAKHTLTIPGLELHLRKQTVKWQGQPLHLTHLEFFTLAYLARHPGWIFTQEQIYEAVWHEFPEDCGAAVVNIISQLRRKMGPGNPIRTVPHSGYKFELPSAD